MNREQAEHILDAYVNMECGGGDNKARISLREVILDAMAYMDKPNTVLPNITLPMASYPQNWDGTPKVTCTGLTVNGMEVFKVHHGPEAKAVVE